MGMRWTEEMARERERQRYRDSDQAWELMHEEGGFEDIGDAMDLELSEFDGCETHLHYHEVELPRQKLQKH